MPIKKPTRKKPSTGYTATAVALALAVVLAAGGGYWLAGRVFEKPATEKQAAFSPPGAPGTGAGGKSPFAPWKSYEEDLPAGIYEPPLAGTPRVTPWQSGDGAPAWIANAVPFNDDASRPAVVIIIDDMGVDRRHSSAMINLPAPLTLSYLTYADDLPGQTAQARVRGHELMLHIPMEPSSGTVDAGPNVLMEAMDQHEIDSILEWALGRFDGYVGINNHMGSRFSESADGMRLVMNAVAARGLVFVDSRTSSKTRGAEMARLAGVAHLERNVFIDNQPDEHKILAQLAKAEELAKRRGLAVAIGHPRDETIGALEKWLPLAKGRGIAVIPLSAAVKRTLISGANGG